MSDDKYLLGLLDILERVSGVEVSSCALVHQSALRLLNLDNNIFLFSLDVLAPEGCSVTSGMAVSDDEGGNAYREFDEHIPLRIWSKVGGKQFGDLEVCRDHRTGLLVPSPYELLELIELSPEIDLLREQRAGLAEVLYFDRMDDEELWEFLSHVRVI